MIFQVPVQAGQQIGQVFSTLEQWGFARFLLPFLLLFVLIYAILQKIKVFQTKDKEPDRKINGIIAFVISALVVIPSITGAYARAGMMDPVLIILSFLPSTGILIVAMLLVLMLTGFVGEFPNSILYIAMWASLAILVLVIINTMIPLGRWMPRDPNTQALIVVLLVMGLIIWFITREPEPGREGAGKRFKAWTKEWIE